MERAIRVAIQPILETWSDQKLSPDVGIFGIRRYLRGAWMSLHLDRLPTHILSAILQVISRYLIPSSVQALGCVNVPKVMNYIGTNPWVIFLVIKDSFNNYKKVFASESFYRFIFCKHFMTFGTMTHPILKLMAKVVSLRSIKR